ncbi:hypothetical protein ACFV4I_16805 [Nocardiopsis alba]|uniref:hypothetical protein n=1 Tax=Nocardiopsis alba TaxID=53437 RepID=UPI003656A37D
MVQRFVLMRRPADSTAPGVVETLQEPYAGVLGGEPGGAGMPLFPQNGEPAQGASALCGEEPVPVGSGDAEVGQERDPGAVGDLASADVLDQVGGVE